MVGARRLSVALMLVLLAGLAAVRAGSELSTKVAGYFAVRCSGLVYNKTIWLYDVEASPKSARTTVSLALDCKIEIREPNLVLGTYPQGFVTQVISGRGREINLAGPPRAQGPYVRPTYRERLVELPAGSPLPPPPETHFQPRWVVELQPNEMTLSCDGNWLAQAGGELRRVKGCFYALVADSVEHVDVPLETAGSWVPLTGGWEVRLEDAYRAGPRYDFYLETRPPQVLSRSWSVGAPLPDWLVAGLQVVSPDGKATPCGERGLLPPDIDANIVGHVPPGGIKAIRFLIAVHPTHCQIPFELQHIPLPNSRQSVPQRQPSK